VTSPSEVPDFARLKAIIERFRLVTGPPIALHRGEPSRQHLVIGTSPCAACAFINGFPAGARACARSRANAFAIVRDTSQPVAFVCHLGFGCATAAVPGARDHWVTIGPFIPEAAAESLEFTVRRGLQAVALPDALEGPLPFTLADITARPPQSMAEAALWVAESITALIPASPGTTATGPIQETEPGTPGFTPAPDRRVRVGRPVEDAREIPAAGLEFPRLPVSRAVPVLWLAGGSRSRALDAWQRRVREQARLAGRARPDWHTLLEITADVLEGCDRLGAQTAPAWDALATLREEVETDPSSAPEETWCHAIFREIRWPADSRHQFRMLCARWLEEIRNGDPDLSAAARTLGIPPATLSIRLRKTIGLTYSGCRSALRLELARRELESSDKPIRLVAEAVGLSDPANLHRLFRRHGLPAPGLYRWLTRAPSRKS